MEGLDFDNILSEQEIDTLFVEPEAPSDTSVEVGEQEQEHDVDEGSEATEVIDPESLFDDGEKPEGVGSEKQEANEKEDTATAEDSGTSPQNFYSSIASALAEDGIFPNLDADAIKGATTAESFSDLIEAEVNARLDDKQQRIAKALENGVEPDYIKQYEGVIQRISGITDAQIAEESEKGEKLRFDLIYQDYLNNGYSQERARKLTERSIDAGTDIEDAKEALQSNKEYFTKRYNQLLDDAQKEAEKAKKERQEQNEKLKNSILNDKQLFGDMELSADIRKKAYESISKPVYRDSETGEYMTALQKYEMEHRADFLKYSGLFYVLTNGYKDFDSFVQGKAKKELRKGLKDLEKKLSTPSAPVHGNMKLVTSSAPDPESFIGKGFKLDI